MHLQFTAKTKPQERVTGRRAGHSGKRGRKRRYRARRFGPPFLRKACDFFFATRRSRQEGALALDFKFRHALFGFCDSATPPSRAMDRDVETLVVNFAVRLDALTTPRDTPHHFTPRLLPLWLWYLVACGIVRVRADSQLARSSQQAAI